MRLTLIAACCIAGSLCSTALAGDHSTNPKTIARQAAVALRPPAPTVGTLPQRNQGLLAANGGDDCSAADVIVGTGLFTFDTTAATSGAQSSVPCGSLNQDVWFSWTAPGTGTAIFSLCGTATLDSMIAVYAASGCPSGPPLVCNDDSCGLQSSLSFAAVGGTNYMLQLGGYGTSTGTGSFSLTLPLPIPNDDCGSATTISGTGSFPFDTAGATTGTQGQGLSCGTGFCQQDVWYSWTAPATGTAIFSLCGSAGFDTLIAAYAGSGCPSAPALGCNDDSCGSAQSNMSFPVSSGSAYMLQIGAFSGGMGAGTFSLTLPPPPPPCGPFDDGSTENLLGWSAGGDMVWLTRFGSAGGSSYLSSIEVAWGSAAFPALGPGNGTATDLFLWADGPSQDGNPSDATLAEQFPVTVANVDTDTYVSYPITPRPMNGIFFVGAHLSHAAGQFVVPMDMTAHPIPGVSWFFGVNVPGQLANYVNPGANVQPPMTLDSIGYMAQVLVRVTCGNNPASYLCDPGSAGVLACPCSNPPLGAGLGCDNSAATGGASISAAGSNSLLSPSLNFTTLGEMPVATTILVQGNAEVSAGAAFGQGVRCAGGLLSRLYVHQATGGSITAPSGLDLDIPARSFALGDPIAAGQDRWYMAYYRDPNVLGGCSAFATFNSTNTAKVTWLP
jgi:hypothetical protein